MTTNVTISAGDTGNPKQGCPENFYITFLNGATVCYLSLSKNGVEETRYARAVVNSTDPTQWAMLIPQSYGSNYTVVAYDASSAGNVIGTGAAFTVAQSIIPTTLNGGLPLSSDARLALIGDSTLAQAYTHDSGYAGDTFEHRWAPLYFRLSGYNCDAQTWCGYRVLTPTNNGRFSGGGAFDGFTGDSTEPVGSVPSTTAGPGYKTRVYGLLAMRPQILFVTVTVNDLTVGTPNTANTIANYKAFADMFTLSGCIVLFALMRPSGISSTTDLNNRVTVNTGIVSFCATTPGAYWWDYAPVYTKVAGGPSAYNDPGQVLDQNITVGVHPTAQGGLAEAESLVTYMSTSGLLSTFNNAKAIYDNAAGYTNYTTAPNFNSGNNGSVVLTNNASGTWLIGVDAVDGPGAAKTAVVGSTEANSDTGGMTQVITLTPAGTGSQIITVLMAGVTRVTPYTGYAGDVQAMMEIETTSDPDVLINYATFTLEGKFGGSAISSGGRTYVYNGTRTAATVAGDGPGTYNNLPRKDWLRAQMRLDFIFQYLVYKLVIIVNATSKTNPAVIKIRRHYMREFPVDYRTSWILPAQPTLAQNGPSFASIVPLIATFATTGVKVGGVRVWYRLSSSNAGWLLYSEFYTDPGVGQVSFTVTGLTAGTSYDFRITPLRFAGFLGGGYGNFHEEGSPSNTITVIPSAASAIGAGQGLIVVT